jgi:hypothetical protein
LVDVIHIATGEFVDMIYIAQNANNRFVMAALSYRPSMNTVSIVVPLDLPSPIRLRQGFDGRKRFRDPSKLQRIRERSFRFTQVGTFIAVYMMTNRMGGIGTTCT